MTTRARWLFAIGVLGILTLVGTGAWWVLHPDYAVLATDLRPADASEIGTALSRWGVPYRFEEGDKTVRVPEESVYQVRMKLAAEGIPNGGSVGFEAFKDSDYGVTEFAQRINYQRALQGELERTIQSMPEVRSVRVHLTIHHAGLFEQNQVGSKGSVTLALREGARLVPRQVAGIQRLVASAVEGLQPAKVTVLDERGAALSAGDAMAGDLSERVNQAGRMETALQAQASRLLARALHRQDFAVSVAVQLNYDRVKRVGNRVLGQGKGGHGVLVREKTDSSHPAGSAPGAAAGPSSSREAEYAHGTEQEEIEQAPGRIERITVGIVLPSGLPQAQVDPLADVVAAGIGLDARRGDKVEIATAAPPVHTATPIALPMPAAAKAPVPAPPTAATRMPLATPLYWLGGGATALVLWFLLSALRAPRTPRLSASEREEALQRIRQWIDTPEQAS